MPSWKKQFDGCLEVDPPVRDEQLAEIPAKRGIVLLVGQNEVPIVMITAASMRSRTAARLAEPHDEENSQNKIAAKKRKSPDLRTITRTIYYKRCGGVFETDWRFLEFAHQVWKGRCEKLVSWKPPWFVHINIPDAYPHFSRTRNVFACGNSGGQYLGPFLSGRDAENFIGAVQDSFSLCRSITCLRTAPNGQKCAYAEMGRCVSPADGTISMPAYRNILAEALDFAGGNRMPLYENLKAQMQSASAVRKFEQAGTIKHRLDRLAFFEDEKFRHVAPRDEFRFILVQQGITCREVKVFFADRGHVSEVGTLAQPTDIKQLSKIFAKITKIAQKTEITPYTGDLEGLRMGLVARLLFSDTSKKSGLIVRWTPRLVPQQLADMIEDAQDDLSLLPPVEKRPAKKQDNTGEIQ